MNLAEVGFDVSFQPSKVSLMHFLPLSLSLAEELTLFIPVDQGWWWRNDEINVVTGTVWIIVRVAGLSPFVQDEHVFVV